MNLDNMNFLQIKGEHYQQDAKHNANYIRLIENNLLILL